MTQSSSGWGPAQPSPAGKPRPAPPGGAGGRRRGRGPLLAALVGVVVFAVSGVATFALTGGLGGRVGESVSCGGDLTCIPGLTSDDVLAPLTAQGWECVPPGAGTSRSCNTQIGPNLYEVQLSGGLENADVISAINVGVAFPEGTPPTDATKSYFAWFASLPYGDDVTRAEVTTWVNETIDAGAEDTGVVIGEYTMGLKLSEPGRIALTVRGA